MLPSTSHFHKKEKDMATPEPAPSTTVAAPEPDQLLEVAEDEVVIDFKPNAKCRADLRLRSLHPSLPVAFKVQTSSPLKFLVSPPRGAVSPLSTATLRVVLRPQAQAPPSFPRSRADRFLVLSALSAAQLDSADDNGGGVVNSARLRVFFGGPYLLRLAADAGDAAAVRLILRRQPHLLPFLEPEAAVPDAEQWAPTMHAAASRGDYGELRKLGPEALAARDREGRTVLHAAAAAGEAEAAAVLVDIGADTMAVDARGRTPLDVAREPGSPTTSTRTRHCPLPLSERTASRAFWLAASSDLARILFDATMELHKYWGVGGRRCGACEAAPAAVHCRTCGGVFLCTACDARPAHAGAGHERVWVCEVCELAPAAVTCKADAAVLCAACDSDIHDANPLARRHTRVPIAPIGSAAAAAAVESMLFGTAGEEQKAGAEQHEHQQHHQHHHHHQHALNLNVEAKDMKLDYLFSDLDPYLNVELPRFQHADSVVPSGVAAVELDFTGGIGVKQTSYSSYTATSLAHSGSSSEVGVVPDTICIGAGGGSFELDFTRPKPQAYMPYTATPPSHSVSSVDAEVVPERSEAAVPRPLMGEGREARLMRYREKRKNRRFEKTIRYASRKAYAETRPRIKGRFAKRTDNDADDAEAEAEAEVAVPSGTSSYMLDFGYSVVPSF